MLDPLFTIFFGSKVGVSLVNNPKNLDPSYEMDLDFLDCFGRENTILQQNFIKHSRDENRLF